MLNEVIYKNGMKVASFPDKAYTVRIVYTNGIALDHGTKSWGAAKRWLMRGAKAELPSLEAEGRLWFMVFHHPTKTIVDHVIY